MFGSIELSVIQLFLQGLAYFQLRKQLLDADNEAALCNGRASPRSGASAKRRLPGAGSALRSPRRVFASNQIRNQM